MRDQSAQACRRTYGKQLVGTSSNSESCTGTATCWNEIAEGHDALVEQKAPRLEVDVDLPVVSLSQAREGNGSVLNAPVGWERWARTIAERLQRLSRSIEASALSNNKCVRFQQHASQGG